MSIQERLVEASSNNSDLLQGLSGTEYALSALNQLQSYLKDIEHSIIGCNKQVDLLASKTRIEKESHEKCRDSIMRRFAYRASGKRQQFEERASKEEREYFEALRAESQARSRKEEWQRILEEAKEEPAKLEDVASNHRALQKELDALYDSLFEDQLPNLQAKIKRSGTACVHTRYPP